jgi:hypothetical protein
VAAPRAAPELQHGDREEREAEREPASQVGRGRGEQREQAINQRRLLGVEGAARAAAGERAGEWRDLRLWERTNAR